MASKALKESAVFRGGITARGVTRETKTVSIFISEKTKKPRFRFEMKSKGGGVSRVHLEIGPGDFSTVIRTMLEADRHAAMTAMVAEFAAQIAMQPELDATIASEARNDVVLLAQRKLVAAIPSNNAAENMIFQSVVKLVTEITKGKKAA